MDISKFATSCIDVSDGIAKDIKNITNESHCGANIFLDKVPFNKMIKNIISTKYFYDAVIGGGEDYELCFTAAPERSASINALAEQLELSITRVGRVTEAKNNEARVVLLDRNSNEINLVRSGYRHFS